MTKVEEHLSLLGMKVEDKVTGFKGIVASISFDLYGCIQAIVHPGMDRDGKLMDQCWFDINRLKVISDYPVMNQPFDTISIANGEQGPADKPVFTKS